MMRNYLMPGFALILLAVFASPRPSPPPQPEAAAAETRPAPASQPAPGPPVTGKMPSLGGSKQIYDPDQVCALAKTELHERLAEFNLDYAEPGISAGPSAAQGAIESAEAMIALVPDPVHTHLALLFDRYIDVVQQALQDSTSEKAPGWIYVSQWLPWDPVPYAASQDPVDRTNTHVFDANRECAPGVLFFRRSRFGESRMESKFLVVFLVGESPTSGILHRDQFRNAMYGLRQVEQRDQDQPRDTLRILGPTFSSTIPSLDALLQQVCLGNTSAACFNHTQVISGFVSTNSVSINRSGNFPALGASHFLSMSEGSDVVRDMLLHYFGETEHIGSDQIAFVSEDETAFGNISSTPLWVWNKDASRSLLFHYPREISQLRNAYEKSSIFSRSSTQQSTGNTNQSDLTLSLEDRHKEEDSVPSFSDTQNPISEESVLFTITRAMKSQGVRVAVINGTDTLDVIFVARFLSRNLPDVRVVLLNADILFLRPPDVTNFRGMLMANTYSLIPDNLMWSGRFLHVPAEKADPAHTEHRSPFGTYLPLRVFPSHEASGLYNAIRLLEMSPLAERHHALFPQRYGHNDYLWLPEYTDPFRGGDHPPLWLSAIGRGDFWPVALLDHYSLDDRNNTAQWKSSLPDISAGDTREVKPDGSIPPGMFNQWTLESFFNFGYFRPVVRDLSVGRLAVACLLALFVAFGIIMCVFARLDRWPEYVFSIPGSNEKRRAWIILVIILSHSWIARLLILDLPPSMFFREPVNNGLLLLEIVLVLFAAWLIGTALSTGRRRLSAWTMVVLTLLGELLFHWALPHDFAARVFFLFRSQHLYSGVCPVLSFIFLFVAIICLVSRHIRALFIFSPRLRPRIPYHRNRNSPPVLTSIKSTAVRDILKCCYSPWRMLHDKKSLWPVAVCIFSVLLLLYLLFPHGFGTLETRSLSIWLTIFSFAIVLFLVLEIGWVVLMWICLQKGLLIPLERTVLRACFNRVSGFSWQRLWFSFDLSPAVRYKPLLRGYESMRRMDTDPYCPAEVKAAIQCAHTTFDTMMAAVAANDTPGRVDGFRRFQWALCNCATIAIEKILSDIRRHREGLVTSLDASTDKMAEILRTSAIADSLEANAEEFVGLVFIYAIQHVLMDIRSHILAFTFGYFFLLLGLNAYPVAPHHSIMIMLLTIFAGFVVAVLVVFSQMHRDAILSRTTSTEPGKLDIGFYQKLISVLGVPIIGLLASQFPEISSFLFSWLEPSLQTLK
jgi:hypothetical protein